MEFRKSTLFAFICSIVFLYNANHISAQTFPPVVLNVDCVTAVTGDSICLDFRVDNFTNVESIQFGISFDATLVTPYCNYDFSNSALGATISEANLGCTNGANGFLNFVWFAEATTVPDGSLLFRLCFDVIGNAGNSSPILINSFISPEICQTGTNGNTICTNDISVNTCPIEIISNTLVAFASKCDADGINNIDNASLTFYAAGGTPPYTYNITPGPITGTLNTAGERVTIPNIPQANYTIVITDNAGLTYNLGPILISNSFPFFIDSINVKNPSCVDRANGMITIASLNEGVQPFTYQWSNLISGTNFNTINELGSGEYFVTITDGSGCALKDSFTLVIDTLKLNLQITQDASCADVRNGRITFGATGGTNWEIGQPYEYQLNSGNWQRFIPPFSITNIAGGNFTFSVRDSLSCNTDVQTFTMPVDRIINMTLEKTDISCFGANDGSVIMTASPLAEYTFIHIQNFPMLGPQVRTDTLSFTNLGPGNYGYRVLDIEGCKDTVYFSIIEPDPILLNEVIVNPGCSTVGSITLNPSGGTPPYRYTWDPIQPGNPNALTDLDGGTYAVTVTDTNDCTATLSTTLNNQGSLDITPQLINPISCFGANDAIVRVEILSATGPFNIIWRDSSGNQVGISQTVMNLGPGTYTVEVTASDGCTNTKSITILDVPGFNISVSVTDALCFTTKGEAVVTINGNATGFTYVWTENGSTAIINTSNTLNAEAGLYDLSVINPLGCAKDTLITITSPPEITFEVPTTTAANCDPTNSGTATIPNPTPDITFRWSSGETGATATKLPPGVNWVIGTRGACNSDTLFFNIDPPGPITFSAPETRNVTCVGLNTGQGVINNGPSGVSYEWSSGETSFFAIMLPAGENWVLARSGSCVSDTVFFTVGTNPPLILDESQTVIQNATCFGDSTGSITIQAIGGTGLTYRYSWTNLNNTTNQATNLGAGGYEVVIMDSNNCTTKDTLFITQPDPLVASIDRIRTVELDCNNQDQGKIVLTTIGGNPGLKAYTWQSGVTADRETASNLSPGTYCATVSDNKGCMDTICYTLVAPAPLVGRLNPTLEPICNGGTTCISIDTIYGGTGNQYTFQINNGIRYPIDSCVTVFASTYSINLIDSAGCSIDTIITIGQPDPISVDLGPDLEIQLGLPSPIINALISSPFPIDTLVWTPIDSLLCLTSNCQTIEVFPAETTTYTLTVTDEMGCTGSDEVLVEVKDIRSVYFANIFTPNRDGNNDFFQVAVGPGVAFVNSFAIFDRWGNQVFLKENYMPDAAGIDGWDGTFNGRALDPGVFVYTARVLFIDGKVIDYSGSVTLAAKVKN
jgi:gliding motility-associated-like protein